MNGLANSQSGFAKIQKIFDTRNVKYVLASVGVFGLIVFAATVRGTQPSSRSVRHTQEYDDGEIRVLDAVDTDPVVSLVKDIVYEDKISRFYEPMDVDTFDMANFQPATRFPQQQQRTVFNQNVVRPWHNNAHTFERGSVRVVQGSSPEVTRQASIIVVSNPKYVDASTFRPRTDTYWWHETSSSRVTTFDTVPTEEPTMAPPAVAFVPFEDKKYTYIETNATFEDCGAYLRNGYNTSGVYEIRVADQVFHALCLMEADYAWMVLQRRSGDTISFNRTFEEYASGFGPHSQDHWLGLEKVATYVRLGHRLQLRVELRGDRCREAKKCSGLGAAGYWWADWNFSLGPRESGYRLTIEPALHGNLSQTNKDFFVLLNNNQSFTTFDRDNDRHKSLNCATFRGYGPWWHKDCTFTALNGRFDDDTHRPRGLFWLYQKADANSVLTSYTIKPEQTLMKFRIRSN